ncbi:MAG: hypothetical protein A3F87_00725 [Omnitrophica WOR_2 bacterium RIFCSPLOWO2_12_FULL_51_24]|nr:MAG: hypothetical protein A3F87_00725 [Omnitrophica WOR_2 bacterium RIFCSPLOWO2_12_FULL_51_24]
MQNDISILLVDDDIPMCEGLKDILVEDGYKITCVNTITSAKRELADKFYNVALVDLKLPDGTGVELAKEVKNINADTIVIVSTGFASTESCIAAMSDGAFSYLQKPLNIDELKITIKKALKMQELSLRNKELLNRLKELSLKDPLTGLYNYRYLSERLPAEFKRSKRYVLAISLIMLDIDYFKSINDIYGHQYGDIILGEIAQFLIDAIRGNDIVVRYGGEEFLIIMPDTDKDGAVTFGKRLLKKINEHIFDPEGKKIKIKASMGIAGHPDPGIYTESDLLNAVDKALLNAKEKGGNRLTVFNFVTVKETEEIIREGGEDNVGKLKDKMAKTEKRANQTLLETIYAFAKTIEAKDYYTSEHGENMVSIATEIGKKFNISHAELENLEHAAMLHDLGKVGIPDSILLKKEKLAEKEYEIIKKHTSIGAEILRGIHFLSGVVPIVLHHHERFDGSGYPGKLGGKDTPLSARIIAVADVYEALIADRPYRKACSKKEALKIIEEGSGTQFDPEVVKAFLEIMDRGDRESKQP